MVSHSEGVEDDCACVNLPPEPDLETTVTGERDAHREWVVQHLLQCASYGLVRMLAWLAVDDESEFHCFAFFAFGGAILRVRNWRPAQAIRHTRQIGPVAPSTAPVRWSMEE